MKRLQLGTSDVSVSAIIMGTSQAGKEFWVGIDDQEITKAFEEAIDCGINTFDTALQYGNGTSERLLGQALHKKRSEVVLLSKVPVTHLHYTGVIESCETSLKNLRTDFIDLYQIHWPSGSWDTKNEKRVPVEETLSALCELKKQGKIRSIGVSNFSFEQLLEAKSFGPIDTIQPPYSLFWRGIEKELLPFCQSHSTTVLAYAALSQGFLSGRFRKGFRFEKGDHRCGNRLFAPDIFRTVQGAIEELEILAKEKSITLSQLALAWVLSHSQVAAIVGARNPEQIRENSLAADFILTPEELERLNQIGTPVSDYFKTEKVIWNISV